MARTTLRRAKKDVETYGQVIKLRNEFKAIMAESKSWTSENRPHVFVSDGNEKTNTRSISFAPGITCIQEDGSLPPCWLDGSCYAIGDIKYEKVRYNDIVNTVLYIRYKEWFWEDFGKEIAFNRFFRLNVDGDLINYNFFCELVEEMKNASHCILWFYTKKYFIVNRFCRTFGKAAIPENLRILYSEWQGLPLVNPFNFPVAFVYENLEQWLANERKADFLCGHYDSITGFEIGNCAECSRNGFGCPHMKDGQKLAFCGH